MALVRIGTHGIIPRSVPLLVTIMMICGMVAIPGSVVGQGGGTGSPSWWNEDYGYRVLIDTDILTFEMWNYPVEIEMDFGALVSEPGFELDPASLVLIEYTSNNEMGVPIEIRATPDQLMAYAVPCIFYQDNDFHGVENPIGVLSWLLSGRTTSTRHFQLYFDDIDGPMKEHPEYGDELYPLLSQYWIQRGTDFYGFNPGEEYTWKNVDGVQVVALYDDTNVEIHDITEKGSKPLLLTKVLDRGGLIDHRVPDGTYFKVSADKPVVASVGSALTKGGSAKTFYPSKDGNLLGRDFLVVTYAPTNWEDVKYGLNIYAIEDARISILDLNGGLIMEAFIEKDGFLEVPTLPGGEVVQIRSSGDVLVEHGAINGFTAVPSVTGAPIGKIFFASTQRFTTEAVILMACEGTNVRAFDMVDGELIFNEDLKGGEHRFLNGLGEHHLRFESTGNISLVVGTTENGLDIASLGDDITFTGGPGGRDIQTYSFFNPGPGPKDEEYRGEPYPGIVFSFTDGNIVLVDGKEHRIDADGYIGLEEGPHHLVSEGPISVMTLGRGKDNSDGHRWNDWGSYLCGALTPPDAKVTSLEKVEVGIDIRPSVQEGAINDTMVHAVEPGKVTTFKVDIENLGSLPDNIDLSLGALPKDWIAELDLSVVQLGSREIREVELTVKVPIDERSETRTNISITGISRADPGVNDTVYAEVVVDPVFYPELTGEAVRYVDPGGMASYELALINRGNGYDNFSIELRGVPKAGWISSLSLSGIRLDSNEIIIFRMNMSAPSDALADSSMVMDVVSRSEGNKSQVSYLRTRTIVNQVYGLEASASEHVICMPGGRADVDLTIKNLGNGMDDFFIDTIDLREDWVIDIPESIQLVHFQESRMVVGIEVPGWDEARGEWMEGPQNVTLQFVITDTMGLERRLNVTIEVQQVFEVMLTAQESEVTVKGKEEAIFELWVRNTGNGQDNITLRSHERVVLGTYAVEVGPGESKKVICTAPSSSDRTFDFQVIASSTGNSTSYLDLTVRRLAPDNDQVGGDYGCLWILLVSMMVFMMVQLSRWHLTRPRK